MNKQWYERYQSIKYKDVTIRLTFPDKGSLNNIYHSAFQPGKWVRSITFESFSIIPSLNYPLNKDDRLNLLMTYCPNVKHVKLPTFMDSVYSQDRWTYFLNALKGTNTWKLHTVSVADLSHFIIYSDARRHYFNCLYHLRRSIRQFALTTGIIFGSYSCYKVFNNWLPSNKRRHGGYSCWWLWIIGLFTSIGRDLNVFLQHQQ